MNQSIIRIKGYSIRTFSLNTIVVGTGAAGLNAADSLVASGQNDIAIVTENINTGTSRNAGSDKQTYYKLTLSGKEPDSILEMAETLFSGQCVDGDVALCEAALSVQCFYKLVELGVPFPSNKYGEYIGYKTDNDPRMRGTSAGPYTSKFMTECLEKSVRNKNIKTFTNLQVIKILVTSGVVRGLLCLNLENSEDPDKRYVVFNCKNVIYATGGPAGIYSDSVYPLDHYGATGIAFEAGVIGQNLTEWQYGLASVNPRWNVSGSFMQVLPRFISTNIHGSDEKEFLFDFFDNIETMLSHVFMKGYQWPFDVKKLGSGSSIIDILVYIETREKGRRVFLDFRDNPQCNEIDYSILSKEAQKYLEKAGATFGKPIDRLFHINAKAIDLYKDLGVDLYKQPLEIALCAQHNNGGLSINRWWHTNIEGFFAAGEVSASHGVYRPGGSALNAGQVGSKRAAQFIAAKRSESPVDISIFSNEVYNSISKFIKMGETVLANSNNEKKLLDIAVKRMNQTGAAIRNRASILQAVEEIKKELNNFSELVKISSTRNLKGVFRLYDILICQYVYLSAMADYMDNGGQSRGSALYNDKNGKCPYDKLSGIVKYSLDDRKREDMVQEVLYSNRKCEFQWRNVRKIPDEDHFFENVWRNFRESRNID